MKHLLALVLLTLCANAQAEIIYGITTSSSASTAGISLVSFNSTTPNNIITIGNFTGVVGGQVIRSIDFQPSTGELYALGTNGVHAQIYEVNMSNAALTPSGNGFTFNASPDSNVAHMSFNPIDGNVSVVTGAGGGIWGTHYYIDSINYGVIQQSNLEYISEDPFINFPSITAISYSNSGHLYGWDYMGNDRLVTVGDPSGLGKLLAIDNPQDYLTGERAMGMSISKATGTAYASHDDPNTGVMGLYSRDLNTGMETFIGSYDGLSITSIAVAVPEPASMALCGLGFMGFAAYRVFRKRTITKHALQEGR